MHPAAQTPTKDALEKKGILLCYNQFAPHYRNFQEMIDELPKIAQMGYNAVWLSPLHPVSQHPKVPSGRKGSLYAPVDHWRWRDEFFKTNDVGQQEGMLKEYTAKAKALGLAPMFDLVMNHMGRTSEEAPNRVELGTDEFLNKEIQGSTKAWFKREPNGELFIDGVHDDKWDDVAKFDYDNEATRSQIIEKLWKPYVEKHIRDLGFQGIRIDAAHKVHPGALKEVLAHATDICRQTHGKAPAILGETLGWVSYDQMKGLEGCHLTHATNGSFWAPLKHDPDNWNIGLPEFGSQWDHKINGNDNNGIDYIARKLRWAVRYDPHNGPPNLYPNTKGGTVSLYDSHDHHSHANKWKDKFDNDTSREQALREAIAVAAFYGDAGSVGCTGVHEADDRHRSVFINENTDPKKENPTINMSKFIRELHMVQAAQPALDIHARTERYFLLDNQWQQARPELVIMVTHDLEHNPNGTIQEKTYLKVANTYREKPVTLSQHNIRLLAIWSNKDPADFLSDNLEEKGIFLCGGITIDKSQSLPGSQAELVTNQALSVTSEHATNAR